MEAEGEKGREAMAGCPNALAIPEHAPSLARHATCANSPSFSAAPLYFHPGTELDADNDPPLDNVLNMHDFEVVAKTILPDKAWVRSQIFFYVCDGATYPKALPRLTTPRHPMMKLLFGRTAWHTRGKFTLVQVSK